MSDAGDAPPRATAGGLLRAAREKQGLHIAALAAAIKVTPRKLDALEHDRYDELPDATFTRALAQTVCRSLKIDPQPVLALLPLAETATLDHVTGTLNAPFRERPGRDDPSGLAVSAIRPMVWAGVALMVAAVLVYVLPSSLWQSAQPAPTSAPSVPAPAPVAASEPAPAAVAAAASAVEVPPAAASAASAAAVVASAPVPAPAAAPAPVVEAARPAPPPPQVAAAPMPAPASASPSTLVQLRADAPSWVEMRDGRGQVLISRIVQPGESVGFDGTLPIKLTIGNAPATKLSFRGKPVDLAPATRDTVARLELQ